MCCYALKAFKCKNCGQASLPTIKIRCVKAMDKDLPFGKCSDGAADPREAYLIPGNAEECEPWETCMCNME